MGKLLIKPSKEDRAGVTRPRTDRSRQRHPNRGQAIHESHPQTSTTPTLPASPRPANKKTYRRFIGVKPAAVFDASQVDPEPLRPPQPTLPAGETPPGLWDAVVELAEREGYRLITDEGVAGV